MSNLVPFKYKAFLSHSHRDKAWGEWLHRALENYKIDKELIGRETSVGPVPKTLRPIFRDRDDFSAGPSLSRQTSAALEASQFLVVICSPNAAKSRYVNEEIHCFRTMGRAERVIPIIVDGEPDNSEQGCFPPALRIHLDARDVSPHQRAEPIAADARSNGDGKETAKHKIVAGLLGVQLDELIRRAERLRKRRIQLSVALAGGVLLLAILASGASLYAWHQLKINEAFLKATLGTATAIVDTAVAQAEKYNVPRTATLELLVKAERLFDDMSRLGRPTPDLKHQKAWMLIHFARNYAILGESEKRRLRANEAHELMRSLSLEYPDNVLFQRDLSVTLNGLGDFLKLHGNLEGAASAYADSLAIDRKLANSDSSDFGFQRDLSLTLGKIGDVHSARGDLHQAIGAFREAVKIEEILIASDVATVEDNRYLSISYYKLGNALLAQNDFEEATAWLQKAVALDERMVEKQPQSSHLQQELTVSYDKLGDLLKRQREYDEALSTFEKSLAIRSALFRSDPSNSHRRFLLSISHSKVGDVYLASHELAEAIRSFREASDLIEPLFAQDPTNTEWARHISGYYQRMGKVLHLQQRQDDALETLNYALEISQRLSETDQTNVVWQEDAGLINGMIGEVLYDQGKSFLANERFRATLARFETLLALDSTNPKWKWNVAIAQYNLALQEDDARRRFAVVVEMLRGLRNQEGQLKAEQQRILADSEEQLARLDR